MSRVRRFPFLLRWSWHGGSLKFASSLAGSIALVLATAWQPAGADDEVTVFAAASLKEAVESLAHDHEDACGCTIRTVLGGSGTLARQIAAGAPADLFVSADIVWMDWLIDRAGVDKATMKVVATNRLVVAVPQAAAERDLAALLSQNRFAIGDPASVPAGRYGRAALESRSLWRQVSANAVFTENVRVALAMVARADVGAAVVYRSDLRLEPGVRAAHEFAATEHPPIVYAAALTPTASDTARRFAAFLASPSAARRFVELGFAAVPGAPSQPDG